MRFYKRKYGLVVTLSIYCHYITPVTDVLLGFRVLGLSRGSGTHLELLISQHKEKFNLSQAERQNVLIFHENMKIVNILSDEIICDTAQHLQRRFCNSNGSFTLPYSGSDQVSDSDNITVYSKGTYIRIGQCEHTIKREHTVMVCSH